uniref:Nuclear factor related to kappa-B-binding protein n=1 Tax=Anthurium amnicola TaxID=1678845 RepID=A0A1D1XJZ0_9ARAE
MAIVKNNFGVSRLDGDILLPGRESVSSQDDADDDADDEEIQSRSWEMESDDTDVSEVDSGMGSDDYDLSELGEAGSEYCQVGNHNFIAPLELFDLPELGSILSLDTWNNCLTEEERFALAEYLPDMDQETYAQTLKELLSGSNFHFGSPVVELFNQLKGGLCEPRVDLYRRCLNFFQRRQHYHQLQKYQNSMVDSLVRMRDAWENYAGYGIEERLRHLNILRQRPSGYMKNGDRGSATDSENDEYAGDYWNKRFKMDQQSMYPSKHSFDSLSHGTGGSLEATKHGKGHPKGILKVAGVKSSKGDYTGTVGRPHLLTHGLEAKQRPSASSLAIASQDSVGFDSRATRRVRNQTREIDGDTEEQLNGMTVHRGNKAVHGSQLAKVASYNQHSFDSLDKDTCTEWNSPVKNYLQRLIPKGSRIGKFAGKEPYHHYQTQAEELNVERESIVKSKKWKSAQGLKVPAYKTLAAQKGELYSHSNHKAKTSLTRVIGKSSQNGMDVGYIKGSGLFEKSDETESESSEQVEEERDVNRLDKKLRHSVVPLENHQSIAVKSASDSKKVKKHTKKNRKGHSPRLDQDTVSHVPDAGALSLKGKHKSKSSGASLQGYPDESFSASAKLSGEQKHGYKLMKKGKLPGKQSNGLELTIRKVHSAEPKRKAMVDSHYTLPQENYVEDYANGNLEEDDFGGSLRSTDRHQATENVVAEVDYHEKANMALTGCNSSMKRRKGEARDSLHVKSEEPVCTQSSPKLQTEDPSLIKKKMKKRAGYGTGSSSSVIPDAIMLEKEPMDDEPEPLLTKKPFTLITPTVHTGFSFSIIHLLSAIRKAMITINAEDAMEIDSHPEMNDGSQRPIRETSQFHEDLEGGSSDEQKTLPCLTVQEIVNRVRTNPGDPCILETQEPLQDLIRGALKIFSSKTAPLGAKGWKALVLYEKSTKSWSWIGPVSSTLSDHDAAEEETSSEAWGIPHKMLVKLVDAFANWLMSVQETLKQIGSLQPLPVLMLPNMDEKERFKDLRAQKSLVTINPSSDEVRAYFHREEFLRYSIPDRAFSYTAIDGRKSIVAPLRRGSGKPTSKARDHFMLKPDRPPHVTILCLVRDAAARLPGSIGTRADVCTLIRDSQYLVEDVSDAQVNSVVSGALDRLHYEQDPCVQFDGDRKIWVYLHRDRDEEDFEDYGTSSTKKWRRPRRDACEHADVRQVTDGSYPEIGDQDVVGPSSGCGLGSDLNVDFSPTHIPNKSEHINNDFGPSAENIESLIDSTENSMHHVHPMGLEVLGENRMLCQENSTNEDFDDEPFTRERHIVLINTSLL